MTDDSDPLEILDAIDRERGDSFIGMIQANQVRRLRTEIVALREMRDAHVRILSASLDNDEEKMRRWIAKARDEALEEAAQACVGSGAIVAEARLCAAAIRALKGKHDADR